MPRRKPKSVEEAEKLEPAADAALPAQDDRAAEATAAANQPEPDATKDAAGEPQRQWTSSLPDPHGHHGTLVSPQGHRVRQLFGRQFHQQKIFFTAPEGINPKPDQKYIDMMHAMGWKWRGSDGMWEKQLLTPEQSAEVRQIREDGKTQEANARKWKYTGPGWEKCQRDYHHLVETMRGDAGMEPSEIITDNLKYLDRAR